MNKSKLIERGRYYIFVTEGSNGIKIREEKIPATGKHKGKARFFNIATE